MRTAMYRCWHPLFSISRRHASKVSVSAPYVSDSIPDKMFTAPPPTPEPAQGTHDVIAQWMSAKLMAKMVGIVAELGIADHLAFGGPKTANELACLTETDADALYRGLRMLTMPGVFTESSDKKFHLTPISKLLISDVPGSMRNLMIFWSQPWHDYVHSHAMHSIKTGEPTFDKVYGKPMFQWLTENPEQLTIFQNAMASFSDANIPFILSAFPFTKYKKIADIGGGRGSFLAHVLPKAPQAKGVLFDIDIVLKGATPVLTQAGIKDRVELVAGDFFTDPFPNACDLYVVKHIMSIYDDEKCISILANCAKGATSNGRVLIIDLMITRGLESADAKVFDFECLVMTTGGKQRTAEEFSVLIEKAGLKLVRIIPTKCSLVILEAKKP